MYMRLAHLQRESFPERGADGKFIDEAAVDAGNRNRAAFTAGVDRLASTSA